MMHTLLQRLRKTGAPDPPAPRGTMVVHEDPGSGAGAVLFQPYRVTEFVPEHQVSRGSRAEACAGRRDAGPDAGDPRGSNPVAEDWRRTSPEVFGTVARRFCARAPKMTAELREGCLAGDRAGLARLAEWLKPTLSLFDMDAAAAAGRLHTAAGEPTGDLAIEVVALEHEIWRVVAGWQAAEGTAGAGEHAATGDGS